jgi:hypothetical protein
VYEAAQSGAAKKINLCHIPDHLQIALRLRSAILKNFTIIVAPVGMALRIVPLFQISPPFLINCTTKAENLFFQNIFYMEKEPPAPIHKVVIYQLDTFDPP